MKINRNLYIAFWVVTSLIAGCDMSTPSEADARTVFEKRYKDEIKNGTVKITKFKKIDGMSGEFGGIKRYELRYEAELEYPKGKSGFNPKEVGEKETRQGKIDFHKTENGWQSND